MTDPTFRIKKFLYGFSEVIESDLQYDAPEVNESVTSLSRSVDMSSFVNRLHIQALIGELVTYKRD